jgi:hypothetical protein
VQSPGVVDAAENVRAGEGALSGEATGADAARDHDGVGRDDAALACPHLALCDVEVSGPLAEHEFGFEPGQRGRRPKCETVVVLRTGEELLRQGRPVVRRVRFGVDQCEAASMTPAAQGLGRRQAGHRGADDENILIKGG